MIKLQMSSVVKQKFEKSLIPIIEISYDEICLDSHTKDTADAVIDNVLGKQVPIPERGAVMLGKFLLNVLSSDQVRYEENKYKQGPKLSLTTKSLIGILAIGLIYPVPASFLRYCKKASRFFYLQVQKV